MKPRTNHFNKWHFLPMIFIILALGLTGCLGRASGNIQKTYEEWNAELQSDLESLQKAYDNLKSSYQTSEEENSGLKIAKESLQSSYNKLSSSFNELRDGYDSLKSEYLQTTGKYSALQGEYDTLNEELAAMKEKFPPKDFTSYGELVEWASFHAKDVSQQGSMYERHLQLQKMALADGYLWNVSYDPEIGVISCVTAGNSIYHVAVGGYVSLVGQK